MMSAFRVIPSIAALALALRCRSSGKFLIMIVFATYIPPPYNRVDFFCEEYIYCIYYLKAQDDEAMFV